jgi:hypothetical protein
MAPITRAQRREYQAKHRRFQKYRERLQREQARAQRSLEALEQALVDLGLPETVAAEVQWRLSGAGPDGCFTTSSRPPAHAASTVRTPMSAHTPATWQKRICATENVARQSLALHPVTGGSLEAMF